MMICELPALVVHGRLMSKLKLGRWTDDLVCDRLATHWVDDFVVDDFHGSVSVDIKIKVGGVSNGV